eukprot:TRINITY_DN12911_c0_g1_i1.p1 TRINITY_DN12911_c0_g1~~TRINITY_DN12911_c0_g1_i1.p1  ORF type:complete len:224 (-),score=21.77 TRINITY_DN12911_c0_g1_i1:93-764(-)
MLIKCSIALVIVLAIAAPAFAAIKCFDTGVGATGHCYECVQSPGILWPAARTAAHARCHNGGNGYLAAIQTAAENDFIQSNRDFLGCVASSISDQYITGGFVQCLDNGPDQGSNQWFWDTTDDAMKFTNSFGQGQTDDFHCSQPGGCFFAGGEPNGNTCTSPNFMVTWLRPDGMWNDSYQDFEAPGYVVEYDNVPTGSCQYCDGCTNAIKASVCAFLPTMAGC